MTTYNTGNPIGSTDSRDRLDNTENMDYLENSTTELTHADRLGTVRKTRHGMEVEHDAQIAAHEYEHDAQMQAFESDFDGQILNMGFTRVGTFAAGATLTNPRQTLMWDIADGGDGQEYGWSGAFPKVIPAASTPASTGGISVGAWISRFDPELRAHVREALRRSYAEAGYNLVDGSFEAGGTLVNVNDALLHEASGKVFSGAAGVVAAGTNPASLGVVDVSAKLLSASVPVMVDYYKYPTTTDTEAIDAAMSASKVVLFGDRKYTYTKPLVSVGHDLVGVVSETFSSSGTIIEFDIPTATSSTFAFRNETKKGSVKNIKFIQKDWTVSLNGARIDRVSSWENVSFNYFNGHGLVLESVDASSRMCYGSTLKSITCDYNAKHGIVLGGAANAIIIENPTCRFNGSPSYGVAPSALGLYDGIYSGGKNSDYTGNPGVYNDPQGCVIIGGDLSYNSRNGLYLDRFFDGAVICGYAEGNFYSDIKIRHMYGSNIVNFMAEKSSDVSVISPDPLNAQISVLTYPNSITIRGKSYGNGQQSSQSGVYNNPLDALLAIGTDGSSKILPSSRGGILCQQTGGGGINWHFGDLPMLARKACVGDGYVDSSSSTLPYLSLKRLSDIEGSEALRLVTSAQFLQMYVVSGSGASATDVAIRVPKHSVTGRSINAGGTVNTNGADYAEYIKKSGSCGDIAKGDIVGINASGELTDKFSESVSFAVKSTNPSFVGGDTWGTPEILGINPPDELTGEESESEIEEYTKNKEMYEIALESARKSVDRIAFCGQVPVNVENAAAGNYVIPVAGDNDCITYTLTDKPTFEQYMSSVGRMITAEKMIVKMS